MAFRRSLQAEEWVDEELSEGGGGWKKKSLNEELKRVT